MKFQTEQLDETMVLIKRDENTLSGSICRVRDHWHVEVLWSGPTGDIVYDAPSLPAALVRGRGREGVRGNGGDGRMTTDIKGRKKPAGELDREMASYSLNA